MSITSLLVSWFEEEQGKEAAAALSLMSILVAKQTQNVYDLSINSFLGDVDDLSFNNLDSNWLTVEN